jgi:hypothetical protein
LPVDILRSRTIICTEWLRSRLLPVDFHAAHEYKPANPTGGRRIKHMAAGVNIVPHVSGPILIAHWRVSTSGQVYDGAGTGESVGEFDKLVEVAGCDAVAYTSGPASDADR